MAIWRGVAHPINGTQVHIEYKFLGVYQDSNRDAAVSGAYIAAVDYLMRATS
jgi:hypothetical protein